MEDKEQKEVDFNEALRRIAQTPKSIVEKVVNPEKRRYNGDEKEAEKTPPHG